MGFEFVKGIVLPLIESFEIPIEDKLRTFTEHVAFQTAIALPNKKGRILITGGGAYNDFLIERIHYYLPEMEIVMRQRRIGVVVVVPATTGRHQRQPADVAAGVSGLVRPLAEGMADRIDRPGDLVQQEDPG